MICVLDSSMTKSTSRYAMPLLTGGSETAEFYHRSLSISISTLADIMCNTASQGEPSRYLALEDSDTALGFIQAPPTLQSAGVAHARKRANCNRACASSRNTITNFSPLLYVRYSALESLALGFFPSSSRLNNPIIPLR